MLHIRIKPRLDCDVVVAGGGPAGSAAANYLAGAGLEVTLIDRQFFPRDKVCGDFVGPLALVELQLLGITDLPEFKKSNIIRYANLHLNGRNIISRSIPHIKNLPSYGRVIPRSSLDQLLFNAAAEAGARGMQGYRVTGYEAKPDFVEVFAENTHGKITLRTKLLIGADGSSSTVARQLRGKPAPRHDRIISVRAYFSGVEGSVDEADLYFDSESFPGYYWLFPTGNHSANVGIGMVLDTLPPSSNRLGELLLRLIKKDPALNRRLQNAEMVGKIAGWPLTTYDASLALVDDRVMLAGDAAGLINPLNGEGIQYALLSGRIAAEAAISHIGQDLSKRNLHEYSSRIEDELRYDMALSNIIVNLIRNRILNPVWLKVLNIIVSRARIDHDYAELTGGILAGLVPAHDALSFKVITGTIEQAVMSLGFEAFWSSLKGPRYLAGTAMKKGSEGIALINETLEHPFDVAGWGFKASACGLELAGQAFSSLLKEKGHRSRSII